MSLEFFPPQTGDPINLKRRVAQQPVRGVPALDTDYVDFRSYGGPVALTPGEIERQVISTGAAPELNLPGKITTGTGPLAMGDLDPADPGLINFYGNVFGKYSVATVGSHKRWIFGLDQPTQAAAYLSMLNDNDVLPPQRFIDVSLGGFTLAASPNSNLAIEFPCVTGDYDFHGLVAQLAGTGPKPMVKRTWSGNWATTDKDIYVKVSNVANISDPADPRVDITTKTGAAGVYGGTKTVHLGKWNRLYDDTGAMYGKRAEQVLIRWEVGATLTATDEFKVPQRRAPWAQSFSPAYPISSINAIFLINSGLPDEEEIRVEGGWTAEMAWGTNEAIPDVYGRQGYTVQRTGKLQGTVTVNRRLVNLDFQYRLHEAVTISVVIDSATDSLIPGDTVPFTVKHVYPLLRPFGTMFDAEAGATNRDEAITLRAAVPSTPLVVGGVSCGSHCNVIVETNVATFAG